MSLDDLHMKGTNMKRKHTERQYKSLTDLKAAYVRGDLNGDESPLMLDNDNSTVYVGGVCVFKGPGGDVLIKEALDLLNIPSDYV